jgi:hypothetical protein
MDIVVKEGRVLKVPYSQGVKYAVSEEGYAGFVRVICVGLANVTMRLWVPLKDKISLTD